MREIELTYQKNIRDLGGLIGFKGMKVKTGRLFRGGFLDKITEEDAEVLYSLHLTDVVDFRSAVEHEIRPDYRLDGVEYHNFPALAENVKKEDRHLEDGNLLWFVRPGSTGYEHMITSYQYMVSSDIGKNAFREFFKLLLSKNDGVFYFHCSQGKDRAGLAAYLIEKALGVDEEVCREDYLKSNKAMAIRVEYLIEKVKNRPYFNEEYKSSLYDVFSAKIDFLEAAIKTMVEMSGSVLDYIKKELDVDIDKLRKIYLE